jgi:23S rRNA (cytosine1962-C5)-methyltransferase
MVLEQLARALERRRTRALPSAETNAYRLVHGAGDDLEGLTVDVYDRFLVASLYTEDDGEREAGWIAALAQLGYRGVYLKRRPRQANQLDAHERRERAPEHAVAGDDADEVLVVRENGVPLEVRLGATIVLESRARLAARAC